MGRIEARRISTASRLAVQLEELKLLMGTDEAVTLRDEFIPRPLDMTREQLIETIADRNYDGLDRSIDVRVTRLRRKIEDDPAAPRYLRTVWGEGYQFTPAGQASA